MGPMIARQRSLVCSYRVVWGAVHTLSGRVKCGCACIWVLGAPSAAQGRPSTAFACSWLRVNACGEADASWRLTDWGHD